MTNTTPKALPTIDPQRCTGCGRCTRACMAKINLKDTLKALTAEYR